MVTQRLDETNPGVCPPLPLGDSGWGGVYRGWAWIAAIVMMAVPGSLVKLSAWP
jgi:hypothetical protein